jgi:hypothetical protein
MFENLFKIPVCRPRGNTGQLVADPKKPVTLWVVWNQIIELFNNFSY